MFASVSHGGMCAQGRPQKEARRQDVLDSLVHVLSMLQYFEVQYSKA